MSTEWQQVFEAENNLEAHLYAGLLAQVGIETRLEGGGLLAAVGELPTDVIAVKILVHPFQLSRAAAILEAHQQPLPEWYCPQCHERNEGQFELCWQCGCEQQYD